jgi:hypothetical protein
MQAYPNNDQNPAKTSFLVTTFTITLKYFPFIYHYFQCPPHQISTKPVKSGSRREATQKVDIKNVIGSKISDSGNENTTYPSYPSVKYPPKRSSQGKTQQ